MSSVYICGKRGEKDDDRRMAILVLYQAKKNKKKSYFFGELYGLGRMSLRRRSFATVTVYCATRILKRNANLTEVGRISPRVRAESV